jgi:hypothetical protein
MDEFSYWGIKWNHCNASNCVGIHISYVFGLDLDSSRNLDIVWIGASMARFEGSIGIVQSQAKS